MFPRSVFAVVAALFSIAISETKADITMLARTWQSEDGLPGNAVRALGQAADGYLWVGTAEGVARFDGQRFTGFSEAEAKLARLPVRNMFTLANGEVWVATTNGSLLRGRESRLQEVRLPKATEDAPVISQVLRGEGDEVLVVRGSELWRVSAQQISPVVDRKPGIERLLVEDRQHNQQRGGPVTGDAPFFLYDSQGRTWRYGGDTKLTLTHPEGEVDPVVLNDAAVPSTRAMLEDREGNIWLATATQGLWRLRAPRVQVWSARDGITTRATQLVMEDQQKAVWVASQDHGIDRVTGEGVKHFDVGTGASRRPISAMMQSRDGTMWAAARDGQVYSWQENGFKLAFPANRGPSKVRAIAEDKEGRIWFGGNFGLSVLHDGQLTRIDLGTPETVTALVRHGEHVWAGSESGRVFRGTIQKFEPVGTWSSFARRPVSGLLPESKDGLWVGTIGGGLFFLQNGKVSALMARMPNADARITCVLDDDAGFLWLGTLGGICRVKKADLLNPARSTAPTLVLDRSDGLLTRECKSGGQPAGWRGHDGVLYFSTSHGVAYVRPLAVAINAQPPPVVIEEAVGNGQAAAAGATVLTAGPGSSRLEFHYTGLSFSAPERVSFRTKLEGLDDTWRDVEGRRTAAYEAVPPGNYRFRVVAENGDGVWNEVGASLPIEVQPHYWERRSFQSLVVAVGVALAVGIGALVMRARMRGRLLRLEAQTSREKERTRIAQDLHDDLGASLTEISILANLAAEEHAPASQPNAALTEVATKAQAVVGVLDEIVWAVNPRHDTLRSLVEYLAAFGGAFLTRAGMTLRRDVPWDLPDFPLNAEQRHNIFLGVREALNNAVKHSGATEVLLRVRVENGALSVSVEDNGRGLPAELGDHCEGLRGMKTRMKAINGVCLQESDKLGTRIRFSLPLMTTKRAG